MHCCSREAGQITEAADGESHIRLVAAWGETPPGLLTFLFFILLNFEKQNLRPLASHVPLLPARE